MDKNSCLFLVPSLPSMGRRGGPEGLALLISAALSGGTYSIKAAWSQVWIHELKHSGGGLKNQELSVGEALMLDFRKLKHRKSWCHLAITEQLCDFNCISLSSCWQEPLCWNPKLQGANTAKEGEAQGGRAWQQWWTCWNVFNRLLKWKLPTQSMFYQTHKCMYSNHMDYSLSQWLAFVLWQA